MDERSGQDALFGEAIPPPEIVDPEPEEEDLPAFVEGQTALFERGSFNEHAGVQSLSVEPDRLPTPRARERELSLTFSCENEYERERLEVLLGVEARRYASSWVTSWPPGSGPEDAALRLDA